jgi:hypothetical protein
MKIVYKHIAISACMLLTACGNADMKESLGLNRKAPDEFRVVSRPPLNVPPEFNLHPPTQGEEYSSGVPAQDQAHSKLLNTGAALPTAKPTPFSNQTLGNVSTAVPAVSTSELPTTADSQFLSNVGASKADPHIRNEIREDAEIGVAPKNDNYLLGNKKDTDPVVDAAKEKERIKEDTSQNKPLTTGDTPVIVPKNKGILGDIF